jgi:hypothetical protein
LISRQLLAPLIPFLLEVAVDYGVLNNRDLPLIIRWQTFGVRRFKRAVRQLQN